MIKYLNELMDLELPEGTYAVFGSGPLAIRGIRGNEDLDVLVTEEVWNELAREHLVTQGGGRPDTIRIGQVQILEVGYCSWQPRIRDNLELIRDAEMIEGVPFVRLEHLLECKKLMDGEKHAEDVERILEHLGVREQASDNRPFPRSPAAPRPAPPSG